MGTRIVGRREVATRVALSACVTVLACALSTSRAAAEEQTHLFNATLSLTGDCTTSIVDPVPDPGCPEVAHPPEGKIVWPRGVTTDRYGDIYVVNGNTKEGEFSFHVDVFDSSGHYLTEVAQEGARTLAVDSTGHLYVRTYGRGPEETVRFDPEVYNPPAKEIIYKLSPVIVNEDASSNFAGVAVDPSNDHLYVRAVSKDGMHGAIFEYGPAVNEVPNAVLNEFASGGTEAGGLRDYTGEIALDSGRHRIYAVDYNNLGGATAKDYINVYSNQSPYELLGTIDGSTTPAGTFSSELLKLEVAADERNGHLFVNDGLGRKKVYELTEEGGYVGTLPRPPTIENDDSSISVDNSSESPNEGFLFTPSGEGSIGHLYAWEPKREVKPPVVESLSFDSVTESEAALHAKVNPGGLATHYIFEYVPLQGFEETGFATATVVGEGDLPVTNEGVNISALATGLSSHTAYEFRVLATNQCTPEGCSGEGHTSFTTFVIYPSSQGCGNEPLRVGASAALPDCRAYELVTPANTGGLRPFGSESGASGDKFPMPTVSPNGENLAFTVEGGLIPGLEGNASFDGNDFLSSRTPSGWSSEGVSPTGPQASLSYAGGFSADHRYDSVHVQSKGSLVIEGSVTSYIRYPDGSFHLAGQGSLATDLEARLVYISADGARAVIESSVELEPGTPEAHRGTVYERGVDGALRVIPGSFAYVGASADGSVVAFSPEGLGAIDMRIAGAQTLAAAPTGSAFAGLSRDGRYLFYMHAHDLYRFDSHTEETTRITETGNVTPVNIAANGTGAYFVSPSVLGEGSNPNGALPVEGRENLYYWDGASLRFVGTVTQRDVEGEDAEGLPGHAVGLGTWLTAVAGQLSNEASRTTPDGSALLFQSHADLTGYEAGGRIEIYRYDAAEGTLICVSCDPTEAKPSSDARLLPIGSGKGELALNPYLTAANLSSDGKRAFFETAERLAPADTDGVEDVYEWEADGKGSCTVAGGCLYLTSSGDSTGPNEIFGITESGNDVFVSTSDLLLPADKDETPSIYDARVEGGFPAPMSPPGECLGEACQSAPTPLDDPTPSSLTFEGRGNLSPQASSPRVSARCPKGKRLTKKSGKGRCVAVHKKRSKHKRRHKKSHTGRKGSR